MLIAPHKIKASPLPAPSINPVHIERISPHLIPPKRAANRTAPTVKARNGYIIPIFNLPAVIKSVESEIIIHTIVSNGNALNLRLRKSAFILLK